MLNTNKVSPANKDDQTYAYYSRIVERINAAIKNSSETQSSIAQKCSKMGIYTTQGAISKMLNYGKEKENSLRTSNLSLALVVCICKVLGIDINSIVDMDPDTEEIVGVETKPISLSKRRSTLVYDPLENEFVGYKGNYFVYMYPTISDEHSRLEGTLDLIPDKYNAKLNAKLTLDTRRTDEDGNIIEKIYNGTLVISNHQRACYCMLVNLDIGEINMITFTHQNFNNQSLQCRLASVVTMAAGGQMRPVCHRMLISRKKISDDEWDVIKAQLLFNTNEIIIPKDKYDLIKDNLSDEVKELFDKEIIAKPFYRFADNKISDLDIKYNERIEDICLLRNNSIAPRYNKISTKADKIVYKYLFPSQNES